eukprot:2460224-Prymnesium_polylepis.2
MGAQRCGERARVEATGGQDQTEIWEHAQGILAPDVHRPFEGPLERLPLCWRPARLVRLGHGTLRLAPLLGRDKGWTATARVPEHRALLVDWPCTHARTKEHAAQVQPWRAWLRPPPGSSAGCHQMGATIIESSARAQAPQSQKTPKSGNNSNHLRTPPFEASVSTMWRSCSPSASGWRASSQQYDTDSIGSTKDAMCGGSAACASRSASMSAKASGGSSCRRGSGSPLCARSLSHREEAH